jgi:hypothetical protein
MASATVPAAASRGAERLALRLGRPARTPIMPSAQPALAVAPAHAPRVHPCLATLVSFARPASVHRLAPPRMQVRRAIPPMDSVASAGFARNRDKGRRVHRGGPVFDRQLRRRCLLYFRKLRGLFIVQRGWVRRDLSPGRGGNHRWRLRGHLSDNEANEWPV